MAPRRAARTLSISLDLVCYRVRDGRLDVLRAAPPVGRKGLGGLPWVGFPAADPTRLDVALARLARSLLGGAPAWIAQLGAFNGGTHPSRAALSVAYLAVVSSDTAAPGGAVWVAADSHAGLVPRQRAVLEAATVTLRDRMDIAPIAFRLLPDAFTLSELQGVYELLLGRGLHKASFRRALRAARLVTPTDEWRSEGRGRPAQRFRYAPRKRTRETSSVSRRSVRFERLD